MGAGRGDGVDARTRVTEAQTVSEARPPSFAQQISDRLTSGEKRGPLLICERTPAVLRLLGFPALPIGMPPGVLFKIAGGKDGSRPPLTTRQIQRIPELLDDPVAIYAQPESALIVLSDECDAKDNPIVVCVRPNVIDGVRRVNLITTAFGKDNAKDWSVRLADALCYRGQKNSPQLPLPGLIYYQTGAHKTEGSKQIVLGPDDLSNYRKGVSAKALPAYTS